MKWRTTLEERLAARRDRALMRWMIGCGPKSYDRDSVSYGFRFRYGYPWEGERAVPPRRGLRARTVTAALILALVVLWWIA